jgi:hypothetical protein
MIRKLLTVARIKLLSWLSPEPEIQAEYVDKVVYLLRRDFNTTEQNQIVKSIAVKLSELRDKDMTEMSEKYAVLQKDSLDLRSVIVC